jgi:predicted ArsR family transcriptional regulator
VSILDLLRPKKRLYRPTSRQAWESMVSEKATLDREIMAVLSSGQKTCQQVEELTGRTHQAVSGNMRHLVEKGLVEPGDAFGTTASGRKAMTWRLTAKARGAQ